MQVAPLGALFLYLVRLCDCDCVAPWLLLGLVQPLLHDDWLHALGLSAQTPQKASSAHPIDIRQPASFAPLGQL